MTDFEKAVLRQNALIITSNLIMMQQNTSLNMSMADALYALEIILDKVDPQHREKLNLATQIRNQVERGEPLSRSIKALFASIAELNSFIDSIADDSDDLINFRISLN